MMSLVDLQLFCGISRNAVEMEHRPRVWTDGVGFLGSITTKQTALPDHVAAVFFVVFFGCVVRCVLPPTVEMFTTNSTITACTTYRLQITMDINLMMHISYYIPNRKCSCTF